MNDLVSVITPAYNCDETIGGTIESVLKQSYENWEMIIVDDCSKDNTMKIIEEYSQKDNRIIGLHLNNNYGVANARNTAIRLSKGKFIAFLDSDDLWYSDKLLKQIKFMNENNYYFTYSDYEFISSDGEKLNKIVEVPRMLRYRDALKGNSIPCLTVVINKEKISKIEMPKIKHEDYATWLNILKEEGITAYGLNENLALYRKSNNSVSSNKFESAKWTWDIYTKQQKFSFLKSLKYMIFYIVKAVIKR